MEELQNRLQKERKLMDMLDEKINEAKSQLVWNKQARVFVHDLLAKNVEAKVGGAKIKVIHEVREVMMAPQKKKGENIIPLSDIDPDDSEQQVKQVG